MSDNLRKQINDIIEADIQIGINDYIEKEGAGEKGQKLNAKIDQREVNKIIKEYKRIKKAKKSNLGEVKKLGLVDKNGKPL
jgi:inhibitor of KinA sporulation pathway (predicted exonuclease)